MSRRRRRRSAWSRLPREIRDALLREAPGEVLRVPKCGHLTDDDRQARDRELYLAHHNRPDVRSVVRSVTILAKRYALTERRVWEILEEQKARITEADVTRLQ